MSWFSSQLEAFTPPPEFLTGIRNDLSEFYESLKATLSVISSTLASFIAQFPDPHDFDRTNTFITDDVLYLAQQLSVRPEFWNEFPLPLQDDFRLSDAQTEHASVMERLVPKIWGLRLNVSRSMSADNFWMIYFLILLPRLNGDAFEHLSTPQILDTRDKLVNIVKKCEDTEKAETEHAGESNLSGDQPEDTTVTATNAEEKLGHEDDDENDESTEKSFSFSDLEDEDEDDDEKSKGCGIGSSTTPSESTDWVKLNKISMTFKEGFDGELDDWLAVDV